MASPGVIAGSFLGLRDLCGTTSLAVSAKARTLAFVLRLRRARGDVGGRLRPLSPVVRSALRELLRHQLDGQLLAGLLEPLQHRVRRAASRSSAPSGLPACSSCLRRRCVGPRVAARKRAGLSVRHVHGRHSPSCLYLVYISIVVLKVYCVLCLTTDAAVVGLVPGLRCCHFISYDDLTSTRRSRPRALPSSSPLAIRDRRPVLRWCGLGRGALPA